jgi:predicted nucleotidyltransferase
MLPPDLIREFKRRAEKALLGRTVRVLLYGSRARDDARPDSDWGVAALLAGPPTQQERSALSDIGLVDLMMESGQHLQPVAVDASRSVDSSSFRKNLHEDGIAA